MPLLEQFRHKVGSSFNFQFANFQIVKYIFILYIRSAKTECQLQKEKEDKKTNTPLKLDVHCTDSGEYAPLQCFPENKFCYCATADGTQITQPSRNRKFCKCDLQKHEAMKKLSVNGRPIERKFKKKKFHFHLI